MDDPVAWTLLVLAALAVVAMAVAGWLGQRRRTAEATARAHARRHPRGSSAGSAPAAYRCPTHPEAASDDPDALCPHCGQRLAPAR